MNKILNIDRYWYKAGEIVSLDKSGYLRTNLYFGNTNLFKYEQLSDHRCVVLLGESGSGKSETIKYELDKLANCNDNKSNIILINLNEYSDENRLIQDVFNSEEINEWQKSTNSITLVLDSYDECLIEIPKLNNIFIRQFDKLKPYIDRLTLRIICRSGYWKERINEYLQGLYSSENYAVFNIAPLQRNDIELFVNEYITSDIQGFFNEIELKKLQPFTLQPISLIALLNFYSAKGILSSDLDSLYYESCRNLCVENNEDRSSSNILSPEKRLAIAARVAAIMTFCNKTKIDLRNIKNNSDAKILSLSDVQEGIELYNNINFNFNYYDIKDVITNTSLFSYNSTGLYSFFHQSHQEYLAARYLIQHQVSLEQIKSLITVVNDKEGKIVEQLSGTASWLCSLSDNYVNEFIQKDPLNILSGDIEYMSDENKLKLFQNLLDKLNTIEIHDFNFKLRDSYHKLKHLGIVEQLKPYLTNGKNQYNTMVRRFAIDVCERCELSELSDVLFGILTSSTEDESIKVEAISALSKIADNSYRQKLKRFALDKSPANDEIKGHALFATVPSIVSIKEAFESLTYPINKSFLGVYKYFVNFKLTEYFSIENIAYALSWYNDNGIERRSDYTDEFSELKNSILLFSWREYQRFQQAQKDQFAMLIFEITKSYANIVPKLKNNDIFKDEYFEIPDDTRRTVLMHIIKNVSTENITTVIYNRNMLVVNRDFEFVINQFQLDVNTDCRESLARILTAFEYNTVDKNDTIIKLYLDDKYRNVLKPYIGHHLDSVDLKSEQAKQLKQTFLYQQEQEQNIISSQKKDMLTKNDVLRKIESTLELCKTSKNTMHLIDVFYYLTFDIESNRYKIETICDNEIFLYDLWNDLNREQKLHIINIAKDYININDDKNNIWKETNNINYTAITGYKCLVLLYHSDPEYVKSIESDVWKKWMHILILCPRSSYVNEDKTYQKVLKSAYAKNPMEFIETLKTKIDIEDKRDVSIYSIFDRINDFVDENILKALFDFIQSRSMKSESLSYIIGFLLEHKYEPILDYLYTLLNEKNGFLSVVVGRKMLQYSNYVDTESLFVKLEKDAEYAKSVFLSPMINYDSSLVDGLNSQQLGQLYVILSNIFPKSEDPTFEGVHYVGAREEAGMFRDKLLTILINMGESEIIKGIQEKLPNDIAISFALINAKDVSRRLNWAPPSVSQFLNLISDTRVRIVTKVEDLLYLIIDSLDRLENKLQKDNPLSFALWNKVSKDINKPKSEEEFSDFIKSHLETDIKRYGAIINREPQFRRPNTIKGGKKGERIDILVSLVADNGDDIAVVIEVKGSWNTGINTSMKEQLHDRYLEHEATKHGLYLVCWCECDAKDESIKNAVGEDNLENARDTFSKQAETLSQNGKTIKSFVLNCALTN